MRVSRATVWRYTQNGTLPAPIRIGGHTWWIEAEILAVIDKSKAARHTPLAVNDPLPRLTKTWTKGGRMRVRLEEAA